MDYKKYHAFKNHIYLIGFGSIGQGVLPLILRHFEVKPEQICIITADDRGRGEARSYGVPFFKTPLTRDNYRKLLGERLQKGDFVVNVSVDVSCVALIELCQEKGALYLDTVVEPWGGMYTDPNLTVAERSNYVLRESALELRPKYRGGPTAVICHGANPGIVGHFVKQALLDIAAGNNIAVEKPATREDWAALAQRLGIKAIHVAERDTQAAELRKQPGEFVNTWSIDGFYSEGRQPSELGWGTHEKALPADGQRHTFGCDSAIYLNRPGSATQVRSWTPKEGPYIGYLITHNESISIADYLTVRENGRVTYRPTCHYAYHPCDDAMLSLHEMNGRGGVLQPKQRLITDEVVTGSDELGVLLMGSAKGVYWFGSRLSIEETRRLAPYNNATSLQVTAAILGAMVWAIENPDRGVLEAEQLDFERIMEIASPYLGEVVGVWGDWNPLQNRSTLFPEDIDETDPWQFKNIRVTPPVAVVPAAKAKTAKPIASISYLSTAKNEDIDDTPPMPRRAKV
ncbi:MAG: saccharopine dehydrogenase C-terminal domain-containing protein [Alphaproteobacteria bacterium]|nr:saccharopine dehydrogenase C-terminal domain-containing protein [Alphaproteobacteria bacterium]